MSHNLNYNEQLGRHAFASVKILPWHELGVIVDNPMTSAEAITQGGIDYIVKKIPLHIQYEQKNGIVTQVVPGNFATTRMDTMQPLGVVGSHYAVIQNSECFKFFDAIVGEGMAMFETVGALGNGERVFITAKLPEGFTVGDDKIDLYLFLTNSHTGREGLIIGFTPTRIVCNNTLNLALGNAINKVKIKHTLNYDQRIAEAAKLMGIVHAKKDTTHDIMNRMCECKIDDGLTLRLIEAVLNPGGTWIENEEQRKRVGAITHKAIADCFDYTLNHTTQQGEHINRTLWGFVNGVTGYHQNVKEYKSASIKMADLSRGLGAKRNRRAFQLAAEQL